MKKIFFVTAVMLCGYTSFAQNTDKLLSSYIGMKNALVNGNSKAASGAVTAFQECIKSEMSFAQKNDLQKAMNKMAKANSIETQRASFNEVSVIMWEVISNAPKVNQPVYYQYCPMKKAYWLSNEKEIRNPYYGSSMLTCGRVVEAKP